MIFCCAYRHQGNGIVERHNRTLKMMAARSSRDLNEMAYWYNNTPNDVGEIPSLKLFAYNSRFPTEKSKPTVCNDNPNMKVPYQEEQQVYVKPSNCKSTDIWRIAEISRVFNDKCIEIDGIPRHLSHVRPCYLDAENDSKEGPKQTYVEIEARNDTSDEFVPVAPDEAVFEQERSESNSYNLRSSRSAPTKRYGYDK